MQHDSDNSKTSGKRVRCKQHECNTSVTEMLHERHERAQHECYTSNAKEKQVKNVDFDNDTSKNIFSQTYIYYMASKRLLGEEQFHSKDCLLEISSFHPKVRWNSFRNFVYASNYVHWKSFAWKWDCITSSKIQTSRIWPRSFKKALIEFYKVHPHRKHKNNTSLFKKQLNFAILLTFKLTLLWLYFGKSCKTTLFRKLKEVSQNTPTFISLGPL